MTFTHTELADRARQDLRELRSPAGWMMAGLPRFARLFGRDSVIVALQLLPEDPAVAAATIRSLAELQGEVYDRRREEEPGKMPHEAPIGRSDWVRMELRKRLLWGFPYYGSIDSTSWWVRLVDRYVAATGDDELLEEVRPNLARAARWMAGDARIGVDDLVAYRRHNRAGLLHQGWRDSDLGAVPIAAPVALVELQGYHADAAAALARLGVDAPRAAMPDSAVFDRRFWSPKLGTYALAVGGDGVVTEVATSNAGHVLGTPILEPPRVDAVADRLFADDLWTPAGIRTHSSGDVHFDGHSYHRGSIWPHDNWIIHEGLRAVGRHDDARRVRRAVLDALCRLESLPELYAWDGAPGSPVGEVVALKVAQPLQAWASGAALAFLAAEASD